MATSKKTTYIEGVGRRKTATARVRLTPSTSTEIVVNEKPFEEYFKHAADKRDVESVLKTENAGIENYSITAKVSGGGIAAQAEAIRLGIARALLKEKESRRGALKSAGFLKRDSRAVERKKFGLKKARKRPAWSKR
jgi:small subunit ribosomal protein S9